MVAEQTAKTCAAETEALKQEDPTGPADAADPEAVLDCLSGRRQPSRIPDPLALVSYERCEQPFRFAQRTQMQKRK